MLSFVVPAHNEQACLGRTVRAIHAAARATGRPYEVIVVDDASTDATAEVARKHDATVVSVNRRQIAASRNAGGRAARGDRLLFVDADTVVSSRVVAAALWQLDRGAAGGGAPARFEGPVPLYAHLLMWWLGWLGWLVRVAGMTGGCSVGRRPRGRSDPPRRRHAGPGLVAEVARPPSGVGSLATGVGSLATGVGSLATSATNDDPPTRPWP